MITIFVFSVTFTELAHSETQSPISELIPGHKVLMIYDSREGTTRENNPLSGLVAQEVADKGFQIIWHDLAKGFPSPSEIRDLRAVITGLLTSERNKANAYSQFVESVIRMGTRFIIIGNFGAYQDKNTKEFLPLSIVNQSFERLGVRYEASWTDDPRDFSVDVKEKRLVIGKLPKSEDILHFYQFTPLREDVLVLVSASHKSKQMESAVVFTSATGAMALSRYLSSDDFLKDKNKLLLSISTFLDLALAHIPKNPNSLLVIYDPSSSDSRMAMESLSKAANYAKVPLRKVSVSSAHDLRPNDLVFHSGLVLALQDCPSPTDRFLSGLIEDYLRRGGSVLSLLPQNDQFLSKSIGMQADGSSFKTSRICFSEQVFPGLQNTCIVLSEGVFSGVSGEVEKNCKPLAFDGKNYLWWECSRGKGRIYALNSYEFLERQSLGILVQSLLDVQGLYAMPVLGANVEFVDDCPLPATGNLIPQLGKTDEDFYLKDFLGMIDTARKRYGIKPVFLPVFSYDENIKPPFGEPYAGIKTPIRMMEWILNQNMTVGLHGMNHLSPATSGGITAHFPDEESLKMYFIAGKEALTSIAGRGIVPKVYVPPNNWMDNVGKKALVIAIPEIRVISSVFAGTQVEMEQEFGRDPDFPFIVAFPRTWAGYRLKQDMMYAMLMGVMLLSVSSHFIHPDDILDRERSYGLSWQELMKEYLSALENLAKMFPFMTHKGIEEAVSDLIELQESGFELRKEGDKIKVFRNSGMEKPIKVLCRVDRGKDIKVISGGQKYFSHLPSGRHWVEMKDRVMEISAE